MTTKRANASKIRSGWSPTMEQLVGSEEGRQIKCLIASAGHLWMRDYYDKLPSAVRKRLAESAYNICAACLTEEAQKMAPHPGIATYFAVIERIERQLS